MFFWILFFVLGSIVGSFLNCLVWRLKNNKNFISERSQCPHCERKLAWYENIPLLSFVCLRGKCKTCQTKIPSYYFVAEFFTGILFVAVFWFNRQNLEIYKIIFELFTISFLVFVFIYDALYKEILPKGVWLVSAVVILYHFFVKDISLLSCFYGALLGFSFFAFQYFVSKGLWIGGGDVRFGLFMGALLGWEKTIVALLFSYWIGALFGLFLIYLKKGKMNSEVPFGTFLTIGTFFTLYFGEYVIAWYQNFLK